MAHPEPGQPQNVQPDVPPSVVDAPTGDAGWTRVHPLTPAINLVAIIVAVIAGGPRRSWNGR